MALNDTIDVVVAVDLGIFVLDSPRTRELQSRVRSAVEAGGSVVLDFRDVRAIESAALERLLLTDLRGYDPAMLEARLTIRNATTPIEKTIDTIRMLARVPRNR